MTFSLTGARSAVREKSSEQFALLFNCTTQNVKAACGVLFNDLMELFRDRPEEGRETRFIFYYKFFDWPGMENDYIKFATSIFWLRYQVQH
jgi:hypothetical protein